MARAWFASATASGGRRSRRSRASSSRTRAVSSGSSSAASSRRARSRSSIASSLRDSAVAIRPAARTDSARAGPRSCASGGRPQAGGCLASRREVAVAEVRLDQHGERRRGFDVAFTQHLGSPFEHPRRDGRLAARHARGCGGEGHVAGVVHEGEQRFGLLEPALTEAEVGELGERVHARPRTGVLRHVQRRLELRFGLRPMTRRHQHASIVGAATGVQERAAVGAHEVVGDAAPLVGTVEVTGEVARREHAARCEDDRVAPAALAAERPGHRFVEQRQTVVDPPFDDEREAQVAERDQLEIDVTGRLREFERPGHQVVRPDRVGGHVALDEPEPSLQRIRRRRHGGRAAHDPATRAPRSCCRG